MKSYTDNAMVTYLLVKSGAHLLVNCCSLVPLLERQLARQARAGQPGWSHCPIIVRRILAQVRI